ncbi:NAD-dependent epimerase/dehydratase family protein [bacterium]|nr:NAD-dependent epimerase/dehydratase family protein [candidate division CSSED10-310 bacterium]
MRILVTGGAGFIASHITDRYLKDGHEVAVVDDLSTGKRENINSEAEFFHVPIESGELKKVISGFRPEIINHHAAHIDLRKSVTQPQLDARINVLGSLNLLSLAVEYGSRKCIFASTGGAIYGEPALVPVSESALPQPMSPYGIHKMATEHYLRVWHSLYDLDYTVLRYPNVFGPRQDPAGEAGVVAIFALQMLSGKRPVIFGDGSKTRDYVYVTDIVEANVLALEKGSREVLNLGWGREVTDLEVFGAVRRAVGISIEPGFDSIRPGEVRRISLDARRAETILGWKPTVSFTEGVDTTVEFYRNNMDLNKC